MNTTRPWLLFAALTATACGGAKPATAPYDKGRAMTHRILIATTSHDRKGDTGAPTGAYLAEIAHPYEVFRKAGYEIEFASVKGGAIPLDGLDQQDAVSAAFLTSPAGQNLKTSLPSTAIDTSRYDAIFFPGGHGAMWDLREDKAFAAASAKIYEAGGVVSAVCHGPAALVDIQLSTGKYLVDGKRVNAFTNAEEQAVGLSKVVPYLLEDALKARGANFESAAMWQPKVVVSDRLVTGQNPASAAPVAEGVVQLLQRQR